MKNSYIIVALSLIASLFVFSCKDDDSAFSGDDNFITSFQLKQGELTFDAFISQDGKIEVKAPTNLSLNNAVAEVVLSELASIAPSPSDISDWDAEQTFEVTSYKGSKKTFTYIVTRESLVKEGDVVLLTQEELDKFAALNLNEIKGSLTIGTAKGNDSIYSLASLSSLTKVQQKLTIAATYAGEDLSGLENLEEVGGVVINNNKSLLSVVLPKLRVAALGLSVFQTNVEKLIFDKLETVDKDFQIRASPLIKELSFPKLRLVAGNMSIQGSSQAKQLININFPALTKIGDGLGVSQWGEVEKVDFPSLESATGLTINSLSKVKSVSAPKLTTIHGTIQVMACNALKELNFSSVKSIKGALSLDNLGLENFEGFKSVESISKELNLNNLKSLTDSKGLQSLKTVGERLYLSDWPMLQDNLDGLANLTQVGGDITFYGIPFKKFSGFKLSQAGKLTVFGTDITSIEEIDVRNLSLTNLSLEKITQPFVLKGPEICDFTVTWDNCLFESVEGFSELKSFTYAMDLKTAPEVVVNVKKVAEQLTLRTYVLERVSFPNLTEVEYFYGSSTPRIMDAPKLKRIGRLNIDASLMIRFVLPALEIIEGDCKIESGTYNSPDKLVEINMPKLVTIKGILDISGFSNYYGNKVLTNLDGFSALKSVKSIKIVHNFALTDFSGLKNAISTITGDDWNVMGNAYNPTFEQMKKGEWVKP